MNNIIFLYKKRATQSKIRNYSFKHYTYLKPLTIPLKINITAVAPESGRPKNFSP